MGAASRRKGTRIERELVEMHHAVGVHAERYPLSGSAPGVHGGIDLDVYAFGRDEAPLVCEVKARGSGEGFKTLERWLSDADALFLRRDRQGPLVVLPWRVWARLIGKRGPA